MSVPNFLTVSGFIEKHLSKGPSVPDEELEINKVNLDPFIKSTI